MDTFSSLPNSSSLFKKPQLNWGVLGTARIARSSVIPAIQSVKHNSVAAVASRDLTRASAFAQELGIARAYGSYAELLADPAVQAVYIPLPNSEHAPWAPKAMQAGKHVLVEKPFALTASEAQLMVSAALENSVVLMEAFMYRMDPRIGRLIEMVREGELGKLRFISSTFTFSMNNPDDYRLKPELGGGALYDVGCYCINFQRLLVGREPLSAQAVCHLGQSGVDLQVSATLDFGDQVFTHFDVAYNTTYNQKTQIIGTEGVLEIERPFNPDKNGSPVWLTKDAETKKINAKGGNNYARLVEHFYNVAISKDLPIFPLSDAVNNMVVIDAIFQSLADGGATVAIKAKSNPSN